MCLTASLINLTLVDESNFKENKMKMDSKRKPHRLNSNTEICSVNIFDYCVPLYFAYYIYFL